VELGDSISPSTVDGRQLLAIIGAAPTKPPVDAAGMLDGSARRRLLSRAEQHELARRRTLMEIIWMIGLDWTGLD
jgi:hypothetical protein